MKSSKVKDLLTPYKDRFGFIGHKHLVYGLEFGDGTQRLGTAWVANFVLFKEATIDKADFFADQLDRLLKQSVDHNGQTVWQYVRHWDETKWPGQPWIMSRDNFEPLWTACELIAPYNIRVKEHLDRMTGLITKRHGFLWNYKHIWPRLDFEPKVPDAYWPHNWASKLIRKKRLWYLWPLLVLLDVDTVLNVLGRLYKASKKMSDVGNDLNLQVNLVYKQSRYWTPTVWVAKMLYRFRPVAGFDGNRIALTGRNAGALSTFIVYYRGDKAPPMELVWKPVIDKYL